VTTPEVASAASAEGARSEPTASGAGWPGRGPDRRIEIPLAGDEVHFESESIGILEEHGVVAGGPVVLARGVDDAGTERRDELVDAVHVLATPGAKAEVVESRAVGIEATALVFGVRPADADSSATADTVIQGVRLHEALHFEEREQLLVEGKAGVEVADRQIDVRDSVELHGWVLGRHETA
jgi:hypothetical protein